MTENESAPLELYISFDSLPTWQISGIMMALSNLYAILRDPDVEINSFDPERGYPNVYRFHRAYTDAVDSELCLDYARTGNSITFRFGGHGIWPAVKVNSSADIEVEFPASWGATAVGVGVLLAGVQYSQDLYDRHLDRQIKRVEISSKQATERLTDAEAEKAKAEAEKAVAEKK